VSGSGIKLPPGAGGRGRPPGTGYKQRQRQQEEQQRLLQLQKDRRLPKQLGKEGGKIIHRSLSESAVRVKVKVKDGNKVKAQVKDGTVSAKSRADDVHKIRTTESVEKEKPGEVVEKRKKEEDTIKKPGENEDKKKEKTDKAKVQKARSLQELTQKVKRKYNKSLQAANKKSTSVAASAGKERDAKVRGSSFLCKLSLNVGVRKYNCTVYPYILPVKYLNLVMKSGSCLC
jgi:hypothetical protein